MQEKVENRSVTLIIDGSKLSDRILKEAIAKYLARRKARSSKDHAGITTMTDIEELCRCYLCDINDRHVFMKF